MIIHVQIGNEDIQTTFNHPFYVVGKGFVRAGKLEVGDEILTSEGQKISIEKIEIEVLAEPVYVYNFTVEDFHTYFVSELGVWVHNTCLVLEGGRKSLLPGEGDIGTYRDLLDAGEIGDNLTPHHMPSAEYMSQYGVLQKDGLCMNMEMPSPGTGGRHRMTDTYGRNMTDAQKAYYYSLSPRDALAYDIKNMRNIYMKEGLYSEMRPKLIEFIKQSKELNPNLFGK